MIRILVLVVIDVDARVIIRPGDPALKFFCIVRIIRMLGTRGPFVRVLELCLLLPQDIHGMQLFPEDFFFLFVRSRVRRIRRVDRRCGGGYLRARRHHFHERQVGEGCHINLLGLDPLK